MALPKEERRRRVGEANKRRAKKVPGVEYMAVLKSIEAGTSVASACAQFLKAGSVSLFYRRMKNNKELYERVLIARERCNAARMKRNAAWHRDYVRRWRKMVKKENPELYARMRAAKTAYARREREGQTDKRKEYTFLLKKSLFIAHRYDQDILVSWYLTHVACRYLPVFARLDILSRMKFEPFDLESLRADWGLTVGKRWYKIDYSTHEIEDRGIDVW